MENPKFQILQSDKDHNYYFRLRAKNGEPILGSEGYEAKQGCKTGIQSVKTNASQEDRYEDRTSQNDQYYFVLKAANGEIIGISEMYTTPASRDNGKAAVKRDTPGAPSEDLTVIATT